MTLTMIDGMDAAERLGLPADPDEDVERRHARASLAAGIHDVVERCAADSGRGGRGRWSLRSSAGYSQPRFRKAPLSASCRAEALARDADRNHSDEVLGFGLYPRLKANVADRGTLGLGIHVMRRAPH
jgi:hypothetical protein